MSSPGGRQVQCVVVARAAAFNGARRMGLRWFTVEVLKAIISLLR